MYFTDRGIEELVARRGDEHVSLAWLADQLVDRVIELVRTWEPTTEWHSQSLTRSGRALEWIVWHVATGADPDLAPLYEDEAESPWAIAVDTLPRYGVLPAVLAPVDE